MAKVEIIGLARSSYTRVVRMVCEEKGIDYDHVDTSPHSPEVNAIHPFGKVPVMRHGEHHIAAILTYVAIARRGGRVMIAIASPNFSAIGGLHYPPFRHSQSTIDHRDIDVLPFPGP